MLNTTTELEYYPGIEYDPEEFEPHKNLPVYKKSLVLRKLTQAVVSTLDEHDEMNLKQLMLEHAYMISSKISGAEAAELYSYRLENALSIKRYANELMTEVALCESKKIGNTKYIQPLINELREFHDLFIDWVESFDKSKDVEDAWALWQDYGGE
jgi:hypothetical protein